MTETVEVMKGEDGQAPEGGGRRRASAEPRFRPELVDELLAGYEKPSDLLGEGGVLKELTKALVERALGAEMSHHLGYAKGEGKAQKRNNTRNGGSVLERQTMLGDEKLDTISSYARLAQFDLQIAQ